MKIFNFISLFVCFVFFCAAAFSEGIKDRFASKDKLSYEVEYGNKPAGKVYWHYLGRELLGEKQADVIYIDSDTKILGIFSLESKEKVFLDYQTHLPLKVERDVVFFGKNELIEEIYNQDEGYVKIIRENGKKKEQVIYRDPPIHNILALLYFFPKDIVLEENKLVIFNLPTQKVKIKMVPHRPLIIDGEEKECYFLLGSGAQRFNLWLDKELRIPLRLEFILPVGKVIITKADYT